MACKAQMNCTPLLPVGHQVQLCSPSVSSPSTPTRPPLRTFTLLSSSSTRPADLRANPPILPDLYPEVHLLSETVRDHAHPSVLHIRPGSLLHRHPLGPLPSFLFLHSTLHLTYILSYQCPFSSFPTKADYFSVYTLPCPEWINSTYFTVMCTEE